MRHVSALLVLLKIPAPPSLNVLVMYVKYSVINHLTVINYTKIFDTNYLLLFFAGSKYYSSIQLLK